MLNLRGFDELEKVRVMQEVSKRNLEVLQQEMEQNAAEAKNSITEEL